MDLKSKKKNFYIIIAISLLIMTILLKRDFKGIVEVLEGANIFFLMIAGIMMMIYIILEAVPFYLIFRARVEKISFYLIAKITFATQFFNAITPFSTGGQPFQIYIINKRKGISYGRITSISVQNFIVYQSALVIHGFLALLVYLFHSETTLLFGEKTKMLIIIGLGLNFLVIAGLSIVANSRRLSHFISINFVNFLAKIKIIKKPLEAREHTLNFLQEFHHDIEVLSKDKKLFLITVGINLVKLSLFYSLTYILCLAIGIENISLLSIIIASSFTMLLTSVFPIPGASGGAEIGFLMFFASIVSGSYETVLMLIWRFFTFYLGLILGFLIFAFAFHGNKNLNKI